MQQRPFPLRRGWCPSRVPLLLCLALLGVLFTLGAATPAHAVSGTISGPETGPILVGAGETLNIVAGAQISGGVAGVVVFSGGTVNISGGSISGTNVGVVLQGGTASISGGTISGSDGVQVSSATVYITGGTISGTTQGILNGGTASITGGSISGISFGVFVPVGAASITGGSISGRTGVLVNGGTAGISGGSISGTTYGVAFTAGTVSISGCNLHLVGNQLIGTLQNGSLINTPTYQVGPQHLANQNTGAPQITCPDNVTTQAASGACSASVNPGSATASDGCSTPPVVTGERSDGKALTDPYSVGTTTITWTATNVAGSVSCSQTVTVQGSTNPTITPPANITRAADAGQCSAQITVGTATATDGCAGALTAVGTRSDGKSLTDPYPVGTTTITWTAADPAGNSASANQTVTVTDLEQPTITCPANITVPATSASGATVSFTVGASDNCPGVSVGAVPPSGSDFPVGTTTVNCTATDAYGNTATCSFTVTVEARADLSLTMSASPSPVPVGRNLTYTLVVQNDGPQPAQGVVLTDPLPAGASFVSASRSANLGTLTTPKAGGGSTVTWNVGTLASGQSATLTLTLAVKATVKPGTTLTNTASVSSSSPLDPNPANNSATVVTPVVAKR